MGKCFVLFQDCSGYSDPIKLHMTFTIIWTVSLKKLAGILIGFLLNLWISLGSFAIFPMLSLPIHRPGTEPMSPAWAEGFLTTRPPGKSQVLHSFVKFIPKFYSFCTCKWDYFLNFNIIHCKCKEIQLIFVPLISCNLAAFISSYSF